MKTIKTHFIIYWKLFTDNGNECYYEVMYDRKCHSEPLRLSKNNRPIGLVLNPVTEKHLCKLIYCIFCFLLQCSYIVNYLVVFSIF